MRTVWWTVVIMSESVLRAAANIYHDASSKVFKYLKSSMMNTVKPHTAPTLVIQREVFLDLGAVLAHPPVVRLVQGPV